MKIILGLAGEIASGKGTIADYIRNNYGGLSYRMSDILRDALKRVHLPESRSNMQKMSKALRQYFGEDILSNTVFNDIKKHKDKIIILDGIRRYSDIKSLEEENNFKLIYVEADLKNRFIRIINRNDNPDDKGKMFKNFKNDHAKETETSIMGLKKRADFIINNNKDFNNLYASVDRIMEKINKQQGGAALQKLKNVAN